MLDFLIDLLKYWAVAPDNILDYVELLPALLAAPVRKEPNRISPNRSAQYTR